VIESLKKFQVRSCRGVFRNGKLDVRGCLFQCTHRQERRCCSELRKEKLSLGKRWS